MESRQEILIQLFAIALGGAVGALIRYSLMLWLTLPTSSLGWGTLAANLVGSFFAGFLAAWMQTLAIADTWRLFLQVGLLGALTTFSTFAVETMLLLAQGKSIWGLVNIGLNLVGSLLMVFLGLWIARNLLS